MKLYYRSQTYEYQPSQQAKQPFQPVRRSGKPYSLKYRGVNYYVDPNTQSDEVTLSPKTYKLIYRGQIYVINRSTHREVTMISQPATFSNLGSVVLER